MSPTTATAPLPPLLSPDWYRLAHIKPRLRSGVQVARHSLRGQTWFVLTDPVSGRHHRFNDLAYALVGACDGQTAIDAIWSARVAALGDNAPTQAETIRVFAQAFAANLFTGDVTPDVAALARAYSRTNAQRERARLNPLAFRVPLWDPDAFLARHVHRVLWAFRPGLWWALGAGVAVAALLLMLNADLMARLAQQGLGTGRMLLLMWLAYPLMKLLHELAHAFAVKRHGGAVHEIGITLLMLTPVPYVDASASVAFASKHKRMQVAGAGIAVELVLASLALPLVLLTEPGLVQDAAFVVVFIGALSSLLVNGNPLLRFDGYHFLCDAIELPNLALRSNRWWQLQFKRRLLRLQHLRFGALSTGEARWLWAYAPLALACRVLLTAGLVLVAARWHPAAGLALLALVLWQMLLQPALAAWRWLRQSPELRGRRAQAGMASAGLALAALATALWLPLPQRTHAPGLVWLPDDALARAETEGFVEEIYARDGQPVQAGTPLVRLSNEALELELATAEADHRQAQVEQALQFGTNARRASDADDALARLDTTRQRLAQRVRALTVRAGVAGRVAIDPARVRLGQMLPQGEVVAQVLPDGAPLVRALVHNDDIALVRSALQGIQVHLPQGGAPQVATLLQATPRASTALPTRALGDAAGGSIALDPADSSGRTAREPLFQIDVRLGEAPAPVEGPAGAFNRGPATESATGPARESPREPTREPASDLVALRPSVDEFLPMPPARAQPYAAPLLAGESNPQWAPVGARVLVTFAHGHTTASAWAWRAVRQTFLRHFER